MHPKRVVYREFKFSVEYGTKILIRKLEKIIQKYVNNKFSVCMFICIIYIYQFLKVSSQFIEVFIISTADYSFELLVLISACKYLLVCKSNNLGEMYPPVKFPAPKHSGMSARTLKDFNILGCKIYNIVISFVNLLKRRSFVKLDSR